MRAESPSGRLALMGAGWALLAVTPVIGPLPGPGGLFTFAGGLILLLRNSMWAKRRYVRAARRWPRLGALADKAMRRPTPRRRAARAR